MCIILVSFYCKGGNLTGQMCNVIKATRLHGYKNTNEAAHTLRIQILQEEQLSHCVWMKLNKTDCSKLGLYRPPKLQTMKNNITILWYLAWLSYILDGLHRITASGVDVSQRRRALHPHF